MRTAAILPVKRFDRAKSRLGASVAETLRDRLARAMVADVLEALARTAAIERTYVVSREPSVAQVAGEHGALLVADEAEQGQSAAVTLGVRRAQGDGIERVLCIPGDCPALDPRELEALLATAEAEAAGGAQVVIVPDRHGTGTNGLLLCPPDAIEPSFGPDSCERHSALAIAAGASWRVERTQSLLLDVDTGADLAALRERLDTDGARATRTREALGRPEPAKVVSALSGN
ncbi:MAG TPA: 2-phospho-L-lactate guanylyltransferase [Solirubrobacteraceae bacterium]|jgi:2-phospho-L-lactate guanylyltransferase|nr:2-phospho-L-lactate guanylyltransferase [Solirubrobacteraceae bacterium]